MSRKRWSMLLPQECSARRLHCERGLQKGEARPQLRHAGPCSRCDQQVERASLSFSARALTGSVPITATASRHRTLVDTRWSSSDASKIMCPLNLATKRGYKPAFTAESEEAGTLANLPTPTPHQHRLRHSLPAASATAMHAAIAMGFVRAKQAAFAAFSAILHAASQNGLLKGTASALANDGALASGTMRLPLKFPVMTAVIFFLVSSSSESHSVLLIRTSIVISPTIYVTSQCLRLALRRQFFLRPTPTMVDRRKSKRAKAPTRRIALRVIVQNF